MTLANWKADHEVVSIGPVDRYFARHASFKPVTDRVIYIPRLENGDTVATDVSGQAELERIARLLAAAPDLAQALLAIQKNCGCMNRCDACELGRVALRKAGLR